MKIYNLDLALLELKGKFLFLDNTALILLVSYIEDFSEFIIRFKNQGSEFLTIPSVVFEFQRTENIEVYNKRTEFLNKYVSIYPIEQYLQKLLDIVPVIHKIKGNVSYSDFLLYCCLYHFKNSILFTENHKDFTTNILDRLNIITIDNGENIVRNSALYQFNSEKYEKVVKSILLNSK